MATPWHFTELGKQEEKGAEKLKNKKQTPCKG